MLLLTLLYKYNENMCNSNIIIFLEESADWKIK